MYLWSKLSAARWLDAWEDRFRGQPNFVLEILKGGKTLRLRVYCRSRHAADEIRRRFGGTVRPLPRSEWAAPPRQTPPPLKIRDRLLVTAATRAADLTRLRQQFPGRQVLQVPAEMAFGTGEHATTASCLRLLVDFARRQSPGWSVADLGCGTALLAIAAKKLGADRAYACDFDPLAVQTARRNLGRNHTPGIRLAVQDILRWKPHQPFDLVLANLFSTVLIEAMPVLRAALAPHGTLILSGILAPQAWAVFTAAARSGLGFPRLLRRGQWVTAQGGHMAHLAGTAP